MKRDQCVRELVAATIGVNRKEDSPQGWPCRRKKGVLVDSEERSVRKLGTYVRQRRKELGITNAAHLDVKIMQDLPSWWIGKTQYLETKQTDFPDARELRALAKALDVTHEHLLFISGYLDLVRAN